MRCEALFLRSWTVDKANEFKNALMPDLVMQAVGAKPPVGPVPGAAPMEGMMSPEGEI